MRWRSPADVTARGGAMCVPIGPCRLSRPTGGGGNSKLGLSARHDKGLAADLFSCGCRADNYDALSCSAGRSYPLRVAHRRVSPRRRGLVLNIAADQQFKRLGTTVKPTFGMSGVEVKADSKSIASFGRD